MMKLHSLLPIVTAAAVLTACAPDADEMGQTDEFGDAVPTTPATEESPGIASDADAFVLNVARVDGSDATYLTDREGRPIYLLEGDTDGTMCTDACLNAWPPVVEEGAGIIRPGDPAVQESMIGRIQRPDGTTQVTYNSHPLYYYAQDAGATQPTGHDFTDQWGEWYLVTPAGDHLEGAALDPGAKGAGSS